MLNLPNSLTLSRLLLLPIFVYLALSKNDTTQFFAALLFGIMALTDLFDGYLARRQGVVTDFGAIFDPLVDRIFVMISLVVLYIKISDLVPLWAVSLVIGRDLIMVIGWIFLKSLRGKKIPVTYTGKVATALLMISLFVLLINLNGAVKVLTLTGLALFYAGVVLSVITGIKYAMSAFQYRQ